MKLTWYITPENLFIKQECVRIKQDPPKSFDVFEMRLGKRFYRCKNNPVNQNVTPRYLRKLINAEKRLKVYDPFMMSTACTYHEFFEKRPAIYR